MIRKRAYSLAEELLDALGEQGYRSTSPRKAIAHAVASQQHHFTAEELRQQLPRVGRATIYRSLKLLVDSGVLCRVLLEDGTLHYQLSHHGHHHHLQLFDGIPKDLLPLPKRGMIRLRHIHWFRKLIQRHPMR